MDSTDFVFSILNIKRSSMTEDEKREAIAHVVVQSEFNLHCAAALISECVLDDQRELEIKIKH